MIIYDIFLDNIKIGTSMFERADAPMGVVSGNIKFIGKPLTFDTISKYCKDNNIVVDEHPANKFISTQTIPALMARNEKGSEIKGIGCYLTGMDGEDYEITIIGIPYPFYEEQFPDHVKKYREQFK